MRVSTFHWKKTVIASATALALVAGPAFMDGVFTADMDAPGLFPQAYAAQGSGQGQQGAGGGGQRGGQAGGQAGGQMQGAGGQGGKSSMDKVLEAEDDGDDSDRPTWAGEPGGEGRPGGGGNPTPGTTKGDEYGDLIVLLRDPDTGLPILNADGEYLVCLDAACEQEPVPTVDGEVPAGVTPVEVDFGRAAVARSPTSVIDKALNDAITKLTVDGVVIETDAAGRITYTVDGVTSTIDSPLENLALYIDLMTGLASDSTSDAEAALGDLATLNTAAALLAGVADKTGEISIDYVFYQNLIADVVTNPDTYYDYDGFAYDRDFGETTYWVSTDGVTTTLYRIDLDAYLDEINGDLPTGDAALFAAAADDALEVIEFVHTQIHTEELPGTIGPVVSE
jgi:hypothetical protein